MKSIILPIVLFFTVSVFAQNTDTINAVVLKEVFIEASRFMNKASEDISKIPLKNIENPQVYSSISNVIMKKQIAMSMEDAMKNATGVNKLWDATGRPDGGSYFTSRGFATTTKVRNGLMTIVSDNVDMANVDRIEVIKGPSATLFGSITPSYGGLINRVTKKPHFNFNGEADFSAGQYNFYRGSADINVPLNKAKTLAARFNLAAKKQNSWQDVGSMNTYNFAPSFLYKPNDRFELAVDAEFMMSKGNSNGGNFTFFLAPHFVNNNLYTALIAKGLPEATVKQIIGAAPQNFKQAFGTNRIDELKLDYNRSFLSDDILMTGHNNSCFAKAEYQISDHWKSQTAANYSTNSSVGRQSYQYLLPNYVPALLASLKTGVPNYGTPGHDQLARMVWELDGYANSLNLQQNLQSDYTFGSMRNRSVIGFDYTMMKNRHKYNRFMGSLYGLPFPDVFDIVPSHGEIPTYGNLNGTNVQQMFDTAPRKDLYYYFNNDVFGSYINNITNITDYVIVSLGLRYDHFKTNGRYNPQTGKFENGNSQSKFSPKLGLVVMPIKDQLSFFANYQNGFTNKFGADEYGNVFKPENANQFETGVKVSLLNDKIAGSFSYYNILVKDIVRQNPKATSALSDIQDGQQSSKGIEAEISANPVLGWMLLLGYGYNDSKFTKASPDVEGLRPQAAGPKHSLNFWTNYTFTKTALRGFGVGLSANYVGEAIAMNQNPDGALVIPSYALLGSSFSYDTPKYRVSLKINNLTNQKYWMGWMNMIPQMPRQIVGSLSYKF